MSQLCRSCHKPAKIIDSRAVDKNATRRRYVRKNEACLDRWSTIEMIVDHISYPKLQRALDNAGNLHSVLHTIKTIAEDAL